MTILVSYTPKRRRPCELQLLIQGHRQPSASCLRNCPSQRSVLPSKTELLQLIQVFQARQDDLLARLLDLAGQEDLVEDGVDLVEVEDEVELADIPEEGVEHLDKEVDGLQVGQLVIVGVDARAEEQPRVPPVDDLVVAELDEVALVLLVARRHEPVDLVRRRAIG